MPRKLVKMARRSPACSRIRAGETPNVDADTTPTAKSSRKEFRSVLHKARAILLPKCSGTGEEQRRNLQSTTSSSSDADASLDANKVTRDCCLSEDNNDHHPKSDDGDEEGDTFLDATQRDGGTVPTTIMTYAPNPSAHQAHAGAPMFLSYGVQPLAPPAVGTRRASTGAHHCPSYYGRGDAAQRPSPVAGGRTIGRRRGSVPPMAAPLVGGYLSATVDNLVLDGDQHFLREEQQHDAAGLDIDRHDGHHTTSSLLLDQPPSTAPISIAIGRQEEEEDNQSNLSFEAKRKAEATRNPRLFV
mmetsp:Transcript_5792/g.16325  ORF Transcript_5792/g.16325 Transcript_5792/m.16325 type:complete len:301 (+) Transcript_5792:252-1154(+)|eukprot:CAMPEP_0181040416 /NCGR_PEP_ID=MMETSP1070-20121207/11036_1 /TAXON_ID=265543 /ORGANISM="Minutocellus polymorphus, Strain NH13" /LENGTH=300 /DNA_ID=CAMNT_0023118423 /DNA_START=167 /DNA_END=1069 /DNA_ORIENTATION=+